MSISPYTGRPRIPKPASFKPSKVFPEGHRNYGKPRCKAWNVNQGRQCLNIAMIGKTVCRFHGGKVPSGIASTQFKHGQYSKHLLPQRLVDAYHKSLADHNQLALSPEIALIDARINDLLQRVDIGESGSLLRNIQMQFEQLKLALAGSDPDAANIAMRDLGRLIERGAGDYAVWREIAQQIYLRRRLVDTERKRLIAMQSMITAEQAMIIVQSLLMSIKDNVTDREALNRIQADFIRITNSDHSLKLGRRAPARPDHD